MNNSKKEKMDKRLTTIAILFVLFLIQSLPDLQGNINLIKQRIPIIISAEEEGYTNIIKNDETVQKLTEGFTKLQSSSNKNLTYLYIDGPDEEGTMNYYKLRYNLLPSRSVKYQFYGYQEFNPQVYTDLIEQFEIDYFLVHRDNGILSYFSIPPMEDVILKIVINENGELTAQVVEDK